MTAATKSAKIVYAVGHDTIENGDVMRLDWNRWQVVKILYMQGTKEYFIIIPKRLNKMITRESQKDMHHCSNKNTATSAYQREAHWTFVGCLLIGLVWARNYFAQCTKTL